MGMTSHPDQILISQLALETFIGAFEDERAHLQTLRLSLVMEPVRDFRGLGDCLENTVDYAAVAEAAKVLALERPRVLVETLAGELAEMLLARFALAGVEVELRKFILPDAEFVAVRLRRVR